MPSKQLTKRRTPTHFPTTIEILNTRSGEITYKTAMTAEEAARIAVREAKKGIYTVQVLTYARRGTTSYVGKPTTHMTCTPTVKRKTGTKVLVSCSIRPAFKKKIRRLA